jgi:hypothetical protein
VTPIDRNSRQVLSDELARLVDGTSTNDEFEARVASLRASPDPVIGAVIDQAWFLYSDLSEHRLIGDEALSPESLAHVERWRRFLSGALPYEWPLETRASKLLGTLANLLTLGWARRRHVAAFRRFGDADRWPFLDASDDTG